MSDVRVYLSGNPVHDRVLTSFYEGIEGSKELVRNWDYKPSKVAVIFGVYKSKVPLSFPRGEIFQRQRSKNLDVIVLETGYINRGDGENCHYAAGFNGLNGRADFRNHDSPDDRAIKLRRAGLLRVLNWLNGGEHVVVCGQVPWDASCEPSITGAHHEMWIAATLERLAAYTRRKILFRPHPLARNALRKFDVEYSVNGALIEDLEKAHAVVTFNSNSGVEAMLWGIPVFAADQGSMVWPIANRSLISIDVPRKPDRAAWLNDLCYAQWSLEEMRNGEAWLHLMRP